eukprot:gene7937-8577_t
MPLELPPLPYSHDALEPYISRRTLEFHHDKHHAKYVSNANAVIAGTELDNADLVSIIRAAKNNGNQGLFNNAAQVWNHTFYWNSLKPNGGGVPTGRLLDLINSSFGSYENFRKEFENAANTAFGSGWAWLVLVDGRLVIEKTSNAETPVTDPAKKPLLTVDVWEHAYYLDYQNLRPDYVKIFFDHLANWEFAESQLP